MKEAFRKHNAHLKTIDVFAYNEGLAELQAPFVMGARPLIAALTALDGPRDEGEGLDPDSIKDYLEDGVVIL